MSGAQDRIVVGLNAVIVAVTGDEPRVLTVGRTDSPATTGGSADARSGSPALPFGPLDPEHDRTLELGLRGWVREQTGIEIGYVEQLYTFADRDRDPIERAGGPRTISVAYLALVHEDRMPALSEARWRDWYEFLPWEDWRSGRPALIEKEIAPALERWVADAADIPSTARRRERVEITFGLGGARWDAERALERYELLYESALVLEARRDSGRRGESGVVAGRPMALDHRRILATALGRIRGKLKYRPVVFELVQDTFTLLQLQRVVEALAGVRLHKQNFRRLVEKGRLVEGTGAFDTRTGGRPAKLFRFRREVLRERLAPGVALPVTTTAV